MTYQFPHLVGEIAEQLVRQHIDGWRFPFISWAKATGFRYRAEDEPLLAHCGSAAEAYMLVELLKRDGAVIDFDRRLVAIGDLTVEVQYTVKLYRVDLFVSRGGARLGVEIDGLAFHFLSPERIANDYLRERRIVASGIPVIRFPASEALRNPVECWRQIEATLVVWEGR